MTKPSSGSNFETSLTSGQDTPQDDDLLTLHPYKEISTIKGRAYSQKTQQLNGNENYNSCNHNMDEFITVPTTLDPKRHIAVALTTSVRKAKQATRRRPANNSLMPRDIAPSLSEDDEGMPDLQAATQ